jgi:hypothetical protein
MRLHINLLAILHLVWGALGVMTGFSLCVLAVGTRAAQIGEAARLGESAAVVLLGVVGGLLLLGGAVSASIGWALRRQHARARLAALVVAVPTLLLVPFGSALAVYTFWVLLNDDARRIFGRPTRAEVPAP